MSLYVKDGVLCMRKYTDDKDSRYFPDFVLPKEVEEIDSDVFIFTIYAQEHIRSINVEGGNPVFYAEGNCLINRKTKELVLGGDNAVIPSDGSVLYIGDFAFTGRKGLKHVVIPNAIVEIGEHSFMDSGIEEITIPYSVRHIGAEAFLDCADLSEVTWRGGKFKEDQSSKNI